MAYILLMLVKRHGVEENGIWKLLLPFTHKDLAPFMGSTRETVTIEMQKLIKQGVLSGEGQMVTINDLDFLKAASQIE
jgi:CRP/FNR family transcriptional regulator